MSPNSNSLMIYNLSLSIIYWMETSITIHEYIFIPFSASQFANDWLNLWYNQIVGTAIDF